MSSADNKLTRRAVGDLKALDPPGQLERRVPIRRKPDVDDVAHWSRSVDNAVARGRAAREGRGYRFEPPESLRAA